MSARPLGPFGHGQFKLYLLALLRDQPRHGYDVIKLVEETFNGAYAPSAGAVYPRLARLEAEGLAVSEPGQGGRRMYRITPAGEEELRRRNPELDRLTADIRSSVSGDIRGIGQDVRDTARSVRAEAGRVRRVRPTEGRRGWFGRTDAADADLTAPAPSAESLPAELEDREPRGITPEEWGPREWREALSWGSEWRDEWSDYWAFGKGPRQVERMLDRFDEEARRLVKGGRAIDARAQEELRQTLGEALVRIRRAVGA
jgi:DNA-binding PadR family transcriptional regulator